MDNKYTEKAEGAVRISTTGNEMTMWICGIRRSSRRYGESDTGLTGSKKRLVLYNIFTDKIPIVSSWLA